MAKAKFQGLGENFTSIFDDLKLSQNTTDNENNLESNITEVSISLVEPSRNQPRKNFDDEKLKELAESISIHGIIQPLVVRKEGEIYRIIAGERRFRAAHMAGISQIPIYVIEADDNTAAAISLIENLQREDLNPIEEALGYSLLSEKYGATQEDIAKAVSKARATIANSLRLLSLPETVKEFVKEGKLSIGHCKVLLSLSDNKLIYVLAKRVVEESLTVRELEKLSNAAKKQAVSHASKKKVSPFITEAACSLEKLLDIPIKITPKKNGLVMEIKLKNEDELKEFIKNFEI